MPVLGGLLVSGFTALVTWLAQYFTRKVAFGAAAVAAYSAITLALFALMRSTLGALAGTVTGAPQMFLDGLGMAVPPVAPSCMSTYITVWTACTVYTWQRDLIKLAATV